MSSSVKATGVWSLVKAKMFLLVYMYMYDDDDDYDYDYWSKVARKFCVHTRTHRYQELCASCCHLLLASSPGQPFELMEARAFMNITGQFLVQWCYPLSPARYSTPPPSFPSYVYLQSTTTYLCCCTLTPNWNLKTTRQNIFPSQNCE